MVDETRLEQMVIRCTEPSFELRASQIEPTALPAQRRKEGAEVDHSISSY